MQSYNNQAQCPFCGSLSVYDEYVDLEDDYGLQTFTCTNCKARCEFDTKPEYVEKAFKAFFTRFIDEEVSDGDNQDETKEADGCGKAEV